MGLEITSKSKLQHFAKATFQKTSLASNFRSNILQDANSWGIAQCYTAHHSVRDTQGTRREDR